MKTKANAPEKATISAGTNGTPPQQSPTGGDAAVPSPEDLAELFGEHAGEIKLWTNFVRDAFAEVAPLDVRQAIHSVSARLKDREHLLEKIPRKRKQGRTISRENFFETVEDLGGVRILTLYRWDFRTVNAFILSAPCWHPLSGPIAYAGSEDDEKKLREAGFEPQRQTDRRYTSIHYIVSPGANAKPWMRCEIQLRGLHLEGWAEVDHQLLYPNHEPGTLARSILDGLHAATVLTDWLAEFARDAAQRHATQRSSDARHLELQVKVRQLEAEIEDLKRRSASHADIAPTLAQAKGTLEQISGMVNRALHPPQAAMGSGGFPGPFSATSSSLFSVASPQTCPGCGDAMSLSITSRPSCPKCKREFCYRCFPGLTVSAASSVCGLCLTGK